MHPDEAVTPRVEVRLLGPFRIAVDGAPVDERSWPRRKAQLLVKLLTVQPHRRMHREQIMELFWPDLDPAAAANQLYKTLHMARRALEPDLKPRGESRYLVVIDHVVTFQSAGEVWVDAEAFERLATAALRSGDAGSADEALALYAGDLLADDIYEEWAVPRREHLRALRLHLLTEVARRAEAAGHASDEAAALHALVAADPSNEEAHVALIRHYARSGERRLAIQQFNACRDALRRELDADPSPATERLAAELLRERPVANEVVEFLESPRAAADETSPAVTSVTAISRVAAARLRARYAKRAKASAIAVALRLAAHWRLAAACALLFAFGVTVPVLALSAGARHRAERAWDKVENAFATEVPRGQRLVSLSGRVGIAGARIEALNSVSGWATYADGDGVFTVIDVEWRPGATYDLVISTGGESQKLVRVTAPDAYPVDGVLPVGEVMPERGASVDADTLYGINSITYVRYDQSNVEYYAGLYDALTLGKSSDDDRLAAITSFVASRYALEGQVWRSDSPRDYIERGSRNSGNLSIAMATIARAGGYQVRLVDMVDRSAGRNAHQIVEVFYDGGWHAFDPSYGVLFRGIGGRIAGYQELHHNVALVGDGYAGIYRPGWNSDRIPDLYGSGIHHFYYFRGVPADTAKAVHVGYDTTAPRAY